nr:MAG: bifunctional (p)ppGpp synthase/hydrolase RelA [uncultured archaeon]
MPKRKFNPNKFAQASRGQKISYRWTIRKRKIDGKDRYIRIRRIKGKIEMQVLNDLRYTAMKKPKRKSKRKPRKKVKITEKKVQVNGKKIEEDITNREFLLGDFDKDGIINIDDKYPFIPSKESIEETKLSDVLFKLGNINKTLTKKLPKLANEFQDIIKQLRPNKDIDDITAFRIKQPISTLSKLVDKRIDTIHDLIGFSYIGDNYEDLNEIKESIAKYYSIQEVDDYYEDKHQLGYKAIHIYAKNKKGDLIEIQLKTKRIKRVSELGHKLYKEKKTNITEYKRLIKLAEKADDNNKQAIEEFNKLTDDQIIKILSTEPSKKPKPKPKPEPKPKLVVPKKKELTPAHIIKLLKLPKKLDDIKSGDYPLFKKEELYSKIKGRSDFELIMLQVYNDHYKSREASTLEHKDFRDFMESRYLNLIDDKKQAWERKRKKGRGKGEWKDLNIGIKQHQMDMELKKYGYNIQGTDLYNIIAGNPEFEYDEMKQEVFRNIASSDIIMEKQYFEKDLDDDVLVGLKQMERDIMNIELGYMRSPEVELYEEKFSKKQSKRIEELEKFTKKQLMELVKSHTKYPSEIIRIYWLKDDIIKCMVRYEETYREKGKRFEQLDRSTKKQLIEKMKKNQETYFGYATMPEYWTKMDVIYWMIHKEAERRNLGKIKASSIKQSEKVKAISPFPTMTKEFPDNIAKGVRGLAEGDREQSIAIDFERTLHQPQRMIAIEGGRTSTIRIDDFEIFGHTHPNSTWVMPSATDLLLMNYKEPEFIVAGKSGKIMFFNVEDPNKMTEWLEKSNEKGVFKSKVGTNPINSETLLKKYGQKIYNKYGYINTLLKDKEGREIFFQETGVRVYPYKKGMKIEMRDDPHLEKKVPSVSYELLYKWKYKQSPDDWENVLRKQKVIRKKVYKKQSNLDKHLLINTKMLEEYGDLKTFDKKQTRIVKIPEINVWTKWVNMTPKELERYLNSLTVKEIKQKSDYSKIQKYKRKSKIIEVLTKEINYLKAVSQFGK